MQNSDQYPDDLPDGFLPPGAPVENREWDYSERTLPDLCAEHRLLTTLCHGESASQETIKHVEQELKNKAIEISDSSECGVSVKNTVGGFEDAEGNFNLAKEMMQIIMRVKENYTGKVFKDIEQQLQKKARTLVLQQFIVRYKNLVARFGGDNKEECNQLPSKLESVLQDTPDEILDILTVLVDKYHNVCGGKTGESCSLFGSIAKLDPFTAASLRDFLGMPPRATENPDSQPSASSGAAAAAPDIPISTFLTRTEIERFTFFLPMLLGLNEAQALSYMTIMSQVMRDDCNTSLINEFIDVDDALRNYRDTMLDSESDDLGIESVLRKQLHSLVSNLNSYASQSKRQASSSSSSSSSAAAWGARYADRSLGAGAASSSSSSSSSAAARGEGYADRSRSAGASSSSFYANKEKKGTKRHREDVAGAAASSRHTPPNGGNSGASSASSSSAASKRRRI